MSEDLFYAHRRLGEELRLSRNFRLAVREFRSALALQPGDALSLAQMALCLKNLGELKAATDAANSALGADPEDGFVHEAAGWTLLAAGRAEDALRHARIARRLRPESVWAMQLNAHAAAKLRDYEGALQAIEEALCLSPNDDSLHGNRANFLRLLGRLDESLRSAAKARELAPYDMWSHLEYARTAETMGAWDDASASYVEALRLEPSDSECRTSLVRVLRRRNPVFRTVLRIGGWFTGMSPSNQVRLFLYGTCFTCGLGFVVFCTFAVASKFAHVSVATSIVDTALRFDRFGRYLLTPAQIVASDRVSTVLLGLTGFLLGVVTCMPFPVLFALPLAAMCLLAATWVRNCRPGRSRQIMGVYVAAVAVIGTLAVVMLNGSAFDRLSAVGVVQTPLGFGLAALAAIGCVFGTHVAVRLGYPWSHRFDDSTP